MSKLVEQLSILKKWPYLLIPLLAACVLMRTSTDTDPAAAKKTAPEALLAAVQLLGGGVGQQAQSVLKDLDQAEARATTGEASAIKKLRPLVEKLTEQDPALTPKDYASAAKVMKLVARDHPDDFDLQLATTKALDFIGNILHANPTQAASPEDDRAGAPNALSRALSLVGKFPNQSRAHEHLAEVLAASGGDQVTAMQSYVRCMQLDPNNRECRSGLNALIADYSRLRCREYRPEALGVHRAALRAKGRKWQRISLGKTELMMERATLLTGKDIAEVTPVGSQKDQALVVLKPNAAALLEGWTQDLADSEAYLVLTVSGQVVGAPRVLSPVSNGQLQLAVSSGKLDKACRLFERRRLPDGVTPPR